MPELSKSSSYSFKEPQNIREALTFLAALSENPQLISQITELVKQRARTYLKYETISGGLYNINESLSKTLTAARFVREAIVNRKLKKTYGHYSTLISAYDCAKICLGFLLRLLPKLHVTLYYLYFQAGTIFRNQGGGRWYEYTCNDEDGYVCKWLTDKPIYRTGYAPVSKAALLPGGYRNKGGLGDADGELLEGELADLLDYEAASGHLPNLLITLCFDTSFTYANVAAVLTVLKAFCEAVKNDTLLERTTNHSFLKNICTKLLPNLKPLTADPEDESASIVSLFNGNENEYKDLLKTEAYNVYIGWLKEKLPILISYLYDMGKECNRWTPYSLIHAEIVGPFTYGFIYGKKWSTVLDRTNVMPNLPVEISKLIGNGEPSTEGTLCALWQCLDPEKYTWPFTSADAETTMSSPPQPGEGASVPEAVTEASSAPVETLEQGATVLPTSPASGKEGHAAEPAATKQSPSVSSSSSSVDAAASAAVPALSKDQTITVDETAGHSSRSQASGPSGANSTATCSTRESCPDHTQYGSSEGATGSAQSTHNANADVNNTQSTITIGGAAGGAAVLGGGCAALYFLNVGGIKTLITGVP
ncbi:secreted antigen 1 [Babesia caballi]|uniref:Secreted antigen 1 n=1 Tax=Babesia caballi TaxID=5871 RepID=A0AAV4M496_BABCB|nr:secreted antigen 1 [Babesia caballi]